MRIATVTGRSLADVLAQLRAADDGAAPWDFLSVHGNAQADLTCPPGARPDGPLHGATSCLGAMTGAGLTEGVAGFAIRDPDGAYGTAMQAYDDDPQGAAAQATRAALARADRLGERPAIVWLSCTPGVEEAVLAGITSVLGAEVPIIGGSAADNSVAGDWRVFDAQCQLARGVVVSVLFPSRPVGFAYHNGYAPTASSGIVTRAEGRRVLTIDDRPALDVYAAWTGGAIPRPAPGQESRMILSDSTLWPLGREMAQLAEVPFHLLAHPAVAHADGTIEMFAAVAEGERLTLMTGTVDSLVERAERVAGFARVAGHLEDRPVAGALMIYCGGCMLRVRPEMDRAVAGVDSALGGAPFLGAFTFGEQGPMVSTGNRHGNLMISCIVFG